MCGTELPESAQFCHKCGAVAPEVEQTADAAPGRRKKKKAAPGLAQTTNDLVGFELMTESGLALDCAGRFSRTSEFADTAYASERRETREDIYEKMCQLHAVFPAGTAYQLNLVNIPEERHSRERAEQLVPTEGADSSLASSFNALIARKQSEGRTDVTRKNYLTISVAADNAEDAEGSLATLRESAATQLDRMQVASRPLDGDARMRLFHNLLRGPHTAYLFDFEKVARGGRARSYVAPEWAAYPANDQMHRRSLQMEGMYVSTYLMIDFGRELSDSAIRAIRDMPIPMNMSLLFIPKPKGEILRRIAGNIQAVEGEIAEQQSKLTAAGIDYNMVPPAMREKREDALSLREHLIEDDQQVAWFQGLVTVYATTPGELKRFESMILETAQLYSVQVRQLPLYQEEALRSAQPLASSCLTRHMRSLTTSESAIMMPWTNEMIHHSPRESYCFVQHSKSLAPLFVNPDKLKSPHTMIFGITGGGKGMLVNTLITHMMLCHPRTQMSAEAGKMVCADDRAPQIIVFDQHGEYGPLAEQFQAPIYKFKPDGQWRLNPFDVQAEAGELKMSDVHRNADFFMALASDVMEGELTKLAQAVIDECLQEVFEPHIGKTTRPTLTDFREALVARGEDEAKDLALAFRIYTDGLMNSFNGQTNIVDDRQLTFYDCSDLGHTMKMLALLSAMQHVKNLTYKNFQEGRPTYAFFEEFQILFENEAAVRMLDSFYGEMRKFGLHMVCITQHPTRVLEHPIAKNLFDNTGLLVFLPMLNKNANYVEDMFQLSASQREAIDVRSEPGKGLLIADGVKIPFNARIDPKWDSELYELFNTDPDRAASSAGGEDTAV